MDKELYFYNGIDLRTATVFDLTADKGYLNSVLIPELDITTKEQYLSLIVKKSNISRVFDLINFAEEKAIPELLQKLQQIFKDDIEKYFNE